MSCHPAPARQAAPGRPTTRRAATVRLALAGQPNVGKSTVFNILTGLNQHVGNWPGKTVERRSGSCQHHDLTVELVDLPGAYSLTAASPEEVVTREYIIGEQPDAVIVVISAAALERNLYLVAELLTLPAPLVIGLNMIDVAKQEGFAVQPEVLEEALGVPVVPMVAARGEGVHELLDAALDVAEHGPLREPDRPQVREDHRAVVEALEGLVAEWVPAPYPVDWVALKLFEGDREMIALLEGAMPPEPWAEVRAILDAHEDAVLAVAGGRYAWIRRMTAAALVRPRAGQVTLTHRLDAVATHPFWGLAVLAGVLALIFALTYSLGGPLQTLLADRVVGPAGDALARLLAGGPAWISGLLVDGVIGGAGTMLTFLPILLIFFASMGVLEDLGYMARAAYVMDRFMHALGLHGKSFLPLFLGFGCNVPAIMGARVIESPRNRLLTIMLAPLVPCTARLGVLAVLVPVFFPSSATLVSWALIGLPLVVLAAGGALANRFLARGDEAPFIMEMPLYHVPNPRTIGLYIWTRILGFLHKAGTVILGMSVLVWALSTLPTGEVEASYLGLLGRAIEPLGRLMGLGWRPLVAMLTSFVAKENAVATLGVLYGVGEAPGALAAVLRASLPPAAGLAFLVAEMLFIPCVSAVAVIRQETNSWKWAALNMLLLTVLALVGGVAAYQAARWVL
jgi:ferrous iron transport protein B